MPHIKIMKFCQNHWSLMYSIHADRRGQKDREGGTISLGKGGETQIIRQHKSSGTYFTPLILIAVARRRPGGGGGPSPDLSMQAL
jgi:hypothetical protein